MTTFETKTETKTETLEYKPSGNQTLSKFVVRPCQVGQRKSELQMQRFALRAAALRGLTSRPSLAPPRACTGVRNLETGSGNSPGDSRPGADPGKTGRGSDTNMDSRLYTVIDGVGLLVLASLYMFMRKPEKTTRAMGSTTDPFMGEDDAAVRRNSRDNPPGRKDTKA
ncbi:hypothetical protein QBC46DRAFT_413886 [Diplogelasinospora grovesii]|uniref:Uncharacterized protein n=1 Tax=Diplogelasinospora grovesii TaxID=303347 RepID=A0AAN6MWP8_9PEZI|nr:hypothetical protein QBC46DRAFT_413886 [Diplogelasinospora grovesii]